MDKQLDNGRISELAKLLEIDCITQIQKKILMGGHSKRFELNDTEENFGFLKFWVNDKYEHLCVVSAEICGKNGRTLTPEDLVGGFPVSSYRVYVDGGSGLAFSETQDVKVANLRGLDDLYNLFKSGYNEIVHKVTEKFYTKFLSLVEERGELS